MAAALTTGTIRVEKATKNRVRQEYKVASGVTAHPGALGVIDTTTQRFRPGHQANAEFAGVFDHDKSVVGVTAASAIAHPVAWGMFIEVDSTSVTGGDIGKDVYLFNDNTVASKSNAGTAATNAVNVGRLVSHSSGTVFVHAGVYTGTDSH